ncbi:putative GRAM domain [Prochlorococcus marinus str. LG]|nr:putative GRAM domain [Prochlorococcus marinus str. LG]
MTFFCFPLKTQASYWLVVGSYRQGPGARPEVSGITSPSLYAIPMKSLELCESAGNKITNDIYKPVWQLDNRWSCIYNGG